jgi:Chaperone of endosialidase
MNTIRLPFLRAVCVAALFLGPICSAQVGSYTPIKADPLVQIDLSRGSIVERVVDSWKHELTTPQRSSLKAQLYALRADQLFAASLSGSLDNVLEVLASSQAARKSPPTADMAKAIGEPARDLSYTPVAPCRILDTRRASSAGMPSPLVGAVLYPFKFSTATSFIDFGGSGSDCGIPAATDVKAVVLSIFLLQEVGLPNFSSYASISDTNDLGVVLQNAVMNFNALEAGNSSAILRTGGSGDQLFIAMPAGLRANFTIEVTGYFTTPTRTGDGLRVTNVNSISPNVINGAAVNTVLTGVRGATIAGGGVADQGDPEYGGDAPNRVTDNYGFVGGGFSNRVGNDNAIPGDAAFATVTGGRTNTAGGSYSFIGGGLDNFATGYISAVAGGEFNKALDSYAFVGGGDRNRASGLRSLVGGGSSNTASGTGSVVSGGESNTAAGPQSSVLGGAGNTASGRSSMVLGGENSVASGPTSLAAGVKANAPLPGCFVWGDSLDATVNCSAADQFVARARGGFQFITGGTTGSYTGLRLFPGDGGWTALSDINSKTDIKQVTPRKVLESLVKIPIVTWRYKAQPGKVTHMGPSAQSFRAAFGLGATPLGISTVDADGVAFAAIQGLNEKLVDSISNRDSLLAAQSDRIARLEKALADLQAVLAKRVK